ncbi:MAG: hypothetical protein AABW47_02490 [Nanoarchaeota archaeon]
MMNKRSLKNRKGIISDYLPWLLIALAVLAIMMIGSMLLKEKGLEFIDKILSIFRGR